MTFSSGSSAASRKLLITATPTSGTPPLRITNVAVRGGSRASGGTNIGFSMSADATYEVRVLSSTGSAVSTISSRAAGAGDVTAFWNGKDAAGRNVAAGNYLVQIRATTTDGESVKVIYPFYVVR
jgi:flagellar hook assembly protein FlgD